MPHDRSTLAADPELPATSAAEDTRRPDRETPPLASAATPSAMVADSVPEWLHGPLARRDGAPEPTLVTGHLTGIDDGGRPLFLAEGAQASIAVAIGISSPDGVIVRAARRQQRALVARTTDEAPRWVLVGLVRDRVSAASRDAKHGRLELTVDGEKLKLEAEHDIELRCGQASITLRYDGRIEVRGTHILSASRGPNRVKGATIALN